MWVFGLIFVVGWLVGFGWGGWFGWERLERNRVSAQLFSKQLTCSAGEVCHLQFETLLP